MIRVRKMKGTKKIVAGLLVVLWLSGGVAVAQKLGQAMERYKAGDLAEAARMFYEVKMTSPQAGERAQAEYYLAQSLYHMGMYQSALAFYNAVFVAGPAHPFYLKGAEGLVKVAEALRDDTLIPSQINKYYNSQEFARLDPMVLSKINFYVGLLLYRQEKYAEAMAFLRAIDPKSSVYPKGLFLQAIIHVRLGAKYNLARDEQRTQAEYDQAIKLFNQILDLSGHEKTKAELAIKRYENIVRLWQLSTLNLARAYYGKGDYSRAVTYYRRIPRFSQDWPDALFELGWAHFMRQEYGHALGTLHTLHSPGFAGKFVPESWILKATVYFHVCLYEEARAVLEHFDKQYAAMLPVLDGILKANLPNEKFASLLLRDELPPDDPMAKVPVLVRNSILESPRVGRFRHFLRALEAEAAAIGKVDAWKGSRLRDELAGIVNVQRNLLVKTAGGFVKANLLNRYQTILGFVSHAKMVRLEITTKERELVKAGLNIKAEYRGKLAPRPRVPDETYNYWPFAGEYWQDELGYYVYTVRRACPAKEQ
ncbi:MAG: tetratricopeptide repeat protein [Deltaproteobacteria bacterium]|nr:MAG: tetratricopeptide repeat protein [Deltaproteobacteria bacterium]